MASASEQVVRHWYDYPVGRAHDPADNASGGELGLDLSTPLNTPITSPWAGTVSYAGSNNSTGGIVKVVSNVPGVGNIGEYFLHLRALAVRPGDTIQAGQVVGISGGDQPGAGGWPHVEYGLFTDLSKASQYWGFTSGSTLDPTGFVNSLHTSGGIPTPGAVGAIGGSAQGPISSLAQPITVTVQSSLGTLLQALPGVSSSSNPASDFLWRAGLITLGVALIIVGVLVTIWPAARSTGQAATQATVAAAKVAA